MTPFVEVDSALSPSRGRPTGGLRAFWPSHAALRRAAAVLIGLALLWGGQAEGESEAIGAMPIGSLGVASATGTDSPSILSCEALWIEYWVKRALGLPCTQPNC